MESESRFRIEFLLVEYHETRIKSEIHHFAESIIQCPNHMIHQAILRSRNFK